MKWVAGVKMLHRLSDDIIIHTKASADPDGGLLPAVAFWKLRLRGGVHCWRKGNHCRQHPFHLERYGVNCHLVHRPRAEMRAKHGAPSIL